MLRLASPGYTKLFQKDILESTFCGGEANVAVSLSIFGLDSAFVTVLPNNDVGRAAQDSMRYFGVDTRNVIFNDGRLGLYYLEKGASQRPSKVLYDRANSAIALSTREDYDWDKIFQGVEWFHWTGINPALGGELPSICEDACIAAKRRGIIISCDINYRGKLWTPKEAQSIMKPLMKYVDVCICNEEDAEKALGIKTKDTNVELGVLNKEGYVKNAEIISDHYGCKYVATTMRKSYSASYNGWSAMLYDSNSKESFFSKEYDIQIVDRVGGGDSFSAGLIYAMTQKMNCQDVIDFATAASCLKHTIEGDYNRTTVSDVQALLKTGGSGRVQR